MKKIIMYFCIFVFFYSNCFAAGYFWKETVTGCFNKKEFNLKSTIPTEKFPVDTIYKFKGKHNKKAIAVLNLLEADTKITVSGSAIKLKDGTPQIRLSTVEPVKGCSTCGSSSSKCFEGKIYVVKEQFNSDFGLSQKYFLSTTENNQNVFYLLDWNEDDETYKYFLNIGFRQKYIQSGMFYYCPTFAGLCETYTCAFHRYYLFAIDGDFKNPPNNSYFTRMLAVKSITKLGFSLSNPTRCIAGCDVVNYNGCFYRASETSPIVRLERCLNCAPTGTPVPIDE